MRKNKRSKRPNSIVNRKHEIRTNSGSSLKETLNSLISVSWERKVSMRKTKTNLDITNLTNSATGIVTSMRETILVLPHCWTISLTAPPRMAPSRDPLFPTAILTSTFDTKRPILIPRGKGIIAPVQPLPLTTPTCCAVESPLRIPS